MSKRGATWRGRHYRRFDQKIRSRKGQRNRHYSDRMSDGELVDFPPELLAHHVRKCRSKVAHATLGAAHKAKVECEREHGCEFYVYECPICGKWHLTTHPWERR